MDLKYLKQIFKPREPAFFSAFTSAFQQQRLWFLLLQFSQLQRVVLL